MERAASVKTLARQKELDPLEDATDHLDLPALQVNFKETKEIQEIVSEFVDEFASSYKQLSAFDRLSLKAVTTIRVHKHSYQLIKDRVTKLDPHFDLEQIGKTISNFGVSLKEGLEQLSKLKAEYFSINNAVINRDANAFKLDQVKRAREKQLVVLDKFSVTETVVQMAASQVKEFAQTYHDWESNLFRKLVDETESLVKDTNNFMEEIDTKLDQMTKDVNKTKQELQRVTPQTKDHARRINAFNAKVAQMEQAIKRADEAMDRHEQTKDRLTDVQEECRALVAEMKKLKLTELVEQTKKIEVIVKSQSEWRKLHEALKDLKESQVDRAEQEAQTTQQELSKLVEAMVVTRKEEYDQIVLEIKQSAQRLAAGAEGQRLRLENFSARYLEGDLAKVLRDADLLFLSKEVVRYGTTIQSLVGQKDATLEESTKLDAYLQQLSDHLGVSNESLSQLKYNLRTLEAQESLDLPRLKQNVDNLEVSALKAILNRLHDDRKQNQGQITSLKRNYDEL